MIKAVLFDLDGVVIVKQEKLFSQRLAEMLQIPLENISEFFEKDFRECSFGKADLKEKVLPFLKRWNFKGDVNEFLKFWFESEKEINKEVLKEMNKLRSERIRCYIATRQEKYRKDYIWKELGLQDHFDGIFCTCDIGYDKWQKEYWNYVLAKLELEPREIAFFCDSMKNVESANNYGIKSYLYTGLPSLQDNLLKLILH